MNPNTHRQARTWVQLQLDGHLDEATASLLHAHLRSCADCRLYALRLEHLDSALKQAYRERTLAQQSALSLPTHNAVPGQMRLKMKSAQITKFATSLLFIAVMAVAVIGFSWLISTRGRMVLPGAGGQPVPTSTPTPTPTPIPWTEDQPSTSVEQISAVLDD